MGAEDLLTAIHVTARVSVVCFAIAYARIRTRPFLMAMLVSHTVHYAAILVLALTTSAAQAHVDAFTVAGGTLIYALMVFAVIHPVPWALHTLWFIFLAAFAGRDMSNPVYPVLLFLLFFVAPAVRGIRASRPPRPVER